MNQTHSKDLTLSAQEARSLHAEIFELMNHCAQLSRALAEQNTEEKSVNVAMDGGKF